MVTCYALSANLDLSLSERRQYPVRTTTSGLPTSPSAFVSTVNATVRCKLINCFGNVFPVLVWCYYDRFIMYYFFYQENYAKFNEGFVFYVYKFVLFRGVRS